VPDWLLQPNPTFHNPVPSPLPWQLYLYYYYSAFPFLDWCVYCTYCGLPAHTLHMSVVYIALHIPTFCIASLCLDIHLFTFTHYLTTLFLVLLMPSCHSYWNLTLLQYWAFYLHLFRSTVHTQFFFFFFMFVVVFIMLSSNFLYGCYSSISMYCLVFTWHWHYFCILCCYPTHLTHPYTAVDELRCCVVLFMPLCDCCFLFIPTTTYILHPTLLYQLCITRHPAQYSFSTIRAILPPPFALAWCQCALYSADTACRYVFWCAYVVLVSVVLRILLHPSLVCVAFFFFARLFAVTFCSIPTCPILQATVWIPLFVYLLLCVSMCVYY